MVEAELTSDVNQFRNGPARTDDAERGQHDIPANERSSQFVARSVGHQLLAGEDDQHVNADIVETSGPVAVEPNLGVRVLELVFEFEDVRIVGHHHMIHAFGCGCSGCRCDRFCRRGVPSYFQHHENRVYGQSSQFSIGLLLSLTSNRPPTNR